MESCSPIYSVISPGGFTADLGRGSGGGQAFHHHLPPHMRAPRGRHKGHFWNHVGTVKQGLVLRWAVKETDVREHK